MPYFSINVSLNGKHFFATSKHSITNSDKAAQVFQEIKKRFPKEEGFSLIIDYNPEQSYTSYGTDLYAILDADIKKYLQNFRS